MHLEKIPLKLRSRIVFAGENDCWIWTGRIHDGYGRVQRNKKYVPVHRLIYALANGPIAAYPEVVIRHSCDNRRCVNPRHLLPGTIEDNVRDRDSRNRTATGENHSRAKLTQKQVDEIRKRYVPRKVTLKQLGEEFRVTLDQIHRIIRRKNWRRNAGI